MVGDGGLSVVVHNLHVLSMVADMRLLWIRSNSLEWHAGGNVNHLMSLLWRLGHVRVLCRLHLLFSPEHTPAPVGVRRCWWPVLSSSLIFVTEASHVFHCGLIYLVAWCFLPSWMVPAGFFFWPSLVTVDIFSALKWQPGISCYPMERSVREVGGIVSVKFKQTMLLHCYDTVPENGERRVRVGGVYGGSVREGWEGFIFTRNYRIWRLRAVVYFYALVMIWTSHKINHEHKWTSL